VTDLNDTQLLRLYYCSQSTRMGIPDQGFPITMKVLEGLGYVKANGKGYFATELGLATLKINNEKLFGKKKRTKKPKLREYEDFDDFED